MTDTASINTNQAKSDIANITTTIKTLRLKYWKEEGETPWDINNGLCDQFADELAEELGMHHDILCPIEFLNLTNTGDDDWTDFYAKSLSAFDLSPTHGFSKSNFIDALKKYADESHVWVVYNRHGIVRHFDAECPEGVTNPFNLPSFDIALRAAKSELDDDKINALFEAHKNRVKSNFFSENSITQDARQLIQS